MARSALKRWLNKSLGALPRAFAGRVLKGLPQHAHDGIDLVFSDTGRSLAAQHCFGRTVSALRAAEAAAPEAYAGLRRDVKRIIFFKADTGLPYHPIQQAIIVPPEVADDSDITCLAAWLLHASEFSDEEPSRHERSARFIRSLPPDEGARVSRWLDETMRRVHLARETFATEDFSNQICDL